jgi:uncharacterized protein (DUF362 family)
MEIPKGNKKKVAVARYAKGQDSVRRAVEMCRALKDLPHGGRVFIKPNVVFWTKTVAFPKWGVVTTSRVVEDMVLLLKEQGIENIIIGEGIVTLDPKDRETPAHAFESLGYEKLKRRYGVKCINVHERPFETVALGDGVELDFNLDFLESDYLVDLPVLKTHAQTVVSLGIKNLKGLLNIRSRKRCHSPDQEKNLNYMIARLPRALPPCFTLIDGIYTNERGPGFDGKLRRSNILIASGDILAADKTGARVLGYEPAEVPYLAHAARDMQRPVDLSDVEIVGEKLDAVSSRHQHSFPYARDEAGELPLPLKRQGIQGISYRKYDLTMCTYCSYLNGAILASIAQAWQGEPWKDVEVLTGKSMQPTPGKKKTILLGKCIYQANKGNSDINEMYAVKSCPPSTSKILEAFHGAGILLDSSIFENLDEVPGFFMKKYAGKPEFDESFFIIE